MTLDGRVLVLNQSFEPLNLCTTRRALVLVLLGKAEVLEHDAGHVRSASDALTMPSVIRLAHQVRKPRPQPSLTRRELFRRDDYSCQYCGKVTADLTLDHVMPRSRGGRYSWENLVTACRTCNQRKGDRTPKEARMTLRRSPRIPWGGVLYSLAGQMPGGPRDEWRAYIPGYS